MALTEGGDGLLQEVVMTLTRDGDDLNERW